MTQYTDQVREHEFDGIREFDNFLPKWWLWTFYLACIFSAGYWFYYHGSGIGSSAIERYNAAMQRKLEKELATKPVSPELLLDFAQQPDNVAAGQQVFEAHCAACHKPDGSGQAGPNLTDAYWLHGGKVEDVYKTIKDGVQGKPMVAWEPILGRQKVMQATAFVMSIKNTNRPGLEPQGEKEQE